MNHSKIPEEGTEEFDTWLNDQEAKREHYLFLEEEARYFEQEGRKGLIEMEMESAHIEI